MAKFVTAIEALSCVKSGDTLMVNSFFTIANPQELLVALNTHIEKKSNIKDLTVYCPGPFGNWDETYPSEQFMTHSAVAKMYCGHYASLPIVSKRILNSSIEAYNLPMGTMSHIVRSAASGKPFYITKTGLNLFPDPRIGRTGLNGISNEKLVDVIKIDDEEYLKYKTPKANVALIRGTYSDEKGNISFEKEYSVVDALSMAQAVKLNGGKVIVQVEKITTEHRRPWNIVIPAILVDMVVICPKQGQSSDVVYDARLSGDTKPTQQQLLQYVLDTQKQAISTTGGVAKRGLASTIVWKRASQFLNKNERVNIGIGLPEGVGFCAAESGILADITLMVETGGIGGVPIGGKGFGATIGAECYLSMVANFDLYEGGGIDKTFVGCLEIDGEGNANAHYVANFITGIGGFINVTQMTKTVCFCTTFTTGGLEVELDKEGNLKIIKEGKNRKFVKNVQAVSFSSKNSPSIDQEVYIVTERCVFKRIDEFWTIIEITKGIDLKKDILDMLPFEVKISEKVKRVEVKCK